MLGVRTITSSTAPSTGVLTRENFRRAAISATGYYPGRSRPNRRMLPIAPHATCWHSNDAGEIARDIAREKMMKRSFLNDDATWGHAMPSDSGSRALRGPPGLSS